MADNLPITAARFSLTVDGETIASFSELNGIKTEIKSTEFVESSENGLIQMNIPANPVMAEISFKRGQTADNKMWLWHEAARAGQMAAARKSATLYMFDAAGEVVAKYNLENAWPAKIELAGLRAGSADVLTETIVLKCDHCQRIQ
jgi:phage tail-like protein